MAATDETRTQARGRMIDTFWSVMETTPFRQMTVREIAARAGVNKNTFYYHFADIDDLARKAIGELLVSDAPGLFLKSELSEKTPLFKVFDDAESNARMKRFRVLYGSNGISLLDIVQDSMLEEWLRAGNAAKSEFSEEEVLTLKFIVGGLFSLSREMMLHGIDREKYARILTLPHIKESLDRMAEIVSRHAQ